ncbi:MAG: ParB N-terminal domain-containing protein [Gammaproteobacteria bacterium]|nr:ParB N-terminal domain-containing protein [Gammaproteobacteria bacterium]
MLTQEEFKSTNVFKALKKEEQDSLLKYTYGGVESTPVKPPESDRSNLTRGFLSGIDQAQAMGYGAGALASKAVGADKLAEKFMGGYRRNIEESKENQVDVQSFSDVDWGSLDSVTDWAAGTLGQLAPSVIESVIGAGIGAAIGGAATGGVGSVPGAVGGFAGKSAIKKYIWNQVGKQLKKDAFVKLAKEQGEDVAQKVALKSIGRKIGSAAGVIGTTAQMEGGSMFAEDVEKHGMEEANWMSASLLGLVSGGSELVSPGGQFARGAVGGEVLDFFKRIAKSSQDQLWKRVGIGVPIAMAKEATQEAFQEFISKVNERVNDPNVNLFDKEAMVEYMNSAAAGAVGGLAFGAAGAISQKPVTPPPTAQEETEQSLNRVFGKGLTVEEAIFPEGVGEPVTEEESVLTTQEKLTPAQTRAEERARTIETFESDQLTPSEDQAQSQAELQELKDVYEAETVASIQNKLRNGQLPSDSEMQYLEENAAVKEKFAKAQKLAEKAGIEIEQNVPSEQEAQIQPTEAQNQATEISPESTVKPTVAEVSPEQEAQERATGEEQTADMTPEELAENKKAYAQFQNEQSGLAPTEEVKREEESVETTGVTVQLKDAGPKLYKLVRIEKKDKSDLPGEGFATVADEKGNTQLVPQEQLRPTKESRTEFDKLVNAQQATTVTPDVAPATASGVVTDKTGESAVKEPKKTPRKEVIDAVNKLDGYVGGNNPGGDWLSFEQKKAKKNDKEEGLRHGSVTLAVREVELPIDDVLAIKGMEGEHKRIKASNEKVWKYAKNMKENGFDPKKAVFINVGYDGTTLINEGNHRVRAAKEAGLKTIPVEISYYAGGELAEGQLSPSVVAQKATALQPTPSKPTPEPKADTQTSVKEDKKADTAERQADTKATIEKEILGTEPNYFVGSNRVDWGSGRGRGKRVGKMVTGAMSDAPKGEKSYSVPFSKLPDFKENEVEISGLRYNEIAEYGKARSYGLDHEGAMIFVQRSEIKNWEKKLSESKSQPTKEVIKDQGVSKTDKEIKFSKEEAQPRLSALHTLTPENLIYADKIGGIAVPSIAVVKGDMAMKGYGSITLIGTKDLADPSRVPVHDADAYSATFPEPEYGKPRGKKADIINDALAEYRKYGTFTSTAYSINGYQRHGNYSKILDTVMRSNMAKAKFLIEEKGARPFRVPFRDIPLGREGDVSIHPKVREFFKGREYMQSDDTENVSELSKIVRGIYTEQEKSIKDGRVRELMVKVHKDRFIKGDLAFGVWNDMQEDQKKINKREPDLNLLRERLDKRLKGKEQEFKTWSENLINSAMGEPFLKISGKREPYTLENIVRKITAQRHLVAEKTITYGPGKARAAAATRFNSLQWMRNASYQMGKPADIKAARDEAEKLGDEYRSAVTKYYKYSDTWSALDDSMKALAYYAKNRSKRGGKAAMRTGLRANDFTGVPNHVVELGVKAGRAMLEAPVPYFEAKPQRAVDLSEFAGAVIPKKTSKRVKSILKKHGIKYRIYGEGHDEAAREEAVIKLRKTLSKQGKDTLFSKDGTKSTGTRISKIYSTLKQILTPAGFKNIVTSGGIRVVDDANFNVDEAKFSKVLSEEEVGKNFKKWSRGYDVLEGYEVADAKPNQGYVFKVHHGTTHKFDTFDPTITGNKEGAFGVVNYFTSDLGDADINYAGEGPDLTQRIEILAEQIEGGYAPEHYNIDPDEVDAAEGNLAASRQLATEKLSGEDYQVLNVFVRLDNPVYVGGKTTTWIDNDVEEQYREDAVEEIKTQNDATDEQIADGEFDDVIKEYMFDSAMYDKPPVVEAIEDVLVYYMDIYSGNFTMPDIAFEPEVVANSLYEDLRGSFQHVEDPETGELVSDHIVGQIFQKLGYDGIVLQRAGKQFTGMGLGNGVSHVHVFKDTPSQIKSDENRGTYSEETGNIFRSKDGSRIQGYYNPSTKQVTLIASNIKPNEVKGLIEHELTHRLLDADAKFKQSIISDIKAVRGKNEAVDAAYEKAKKAEPNRPDLWDEENLTYFLANTANQNQSLYKKIITKVRAWLRRTFGLKFVKNLTTADIREITLQSIRKFEAKGVATATDSTATAINEFAQPVRMSVKQAGRKIANMVAFKKWFGDSKVVDESGTPLVFYHGTTADFSVFSLDKIKSRFPQSFGLHFTTRPTEASVYAKQPAYGPGKEHLGGAVYPVYIKTENPLEIKTDYVSASMEADLEKPAILRQLDDAIKEGKPYDSVIITAQEGDKEYGGKNIIVFDPTQIKSIFNTKWNPSDPDIMKSVAEHATAFYSKLQTFSFPKGAKAMKAGSLLAKLRNVAKKEEIEATQIDVWLKEKGQSKVTKQELDDYIKSNMIETEDVVLGEPTEDEIDVLLGDEMGEGMTRDEARQYLQNDEGRTQFATYQEPGGSNYREMFVTAPSKSRSMLTELPKEYGVAKRGEVWWVNKQGSKAHTASSEISRDDAVRKALLHINETRDLISGEHTNHWQDGHSQYSDIQNPIVRIRFNERTDSQGRKILFIEEMQGPSPSEQKKMPSYLKGNLYNIGTKRVLAYAKEHGFDGISWTTGTMQADRYDVAEKVKNVTWAKRNDGTYDLTVNAIDGSIPSSMFDRQTEDELVNIVGKELADRIIKDKGKKAGVSGYDTVGELKGEGLRIGAEGLRRLYDQDLGNMLKKYGKNKVRLTEIGTADELFLIKRDGSEFVIQNDAAKYWKSDRGDDGVFVNAIEDADHFNNKEAANNIRVTAVKKQFGSSKVPFVPITKKTPASYPLFSMGDKTTSSQSNAKPEYEKLGTREFIRKYGSKELKASYFALEQILPKKELEGIKVEVIDGNNEMGVGGKYIPKDKTVKMFTQGYRGSFSNETFAATLLHESIHAITYHKLQHEPAIRRELDGLRKRVARKILSKEEHKVFRKYNGKASEYNGMIASRIKKGDALSDIGIRDGKARLIYMLLSNDEFLANATHPEMQEQLGTVDATIRAKFMKQIKDLFMRIFGWSRDQYTAYEQAMSAIGRLNQEIEFTLPDKEQVEQSGFFERGTQNTREYTEGQKKFDKKGGFSVHEKESLKDKFDNARVLFGAKMRQGFVDQYDSFARILDDKKAWMMGHLTKASPQAVMAAIHTGTPFIEESGAVDIKKGSKHLRTIFKPLGTEVNDFLKWFAAHRAYKLSNEEVSRENLFTDDEIKHGMTLDQGFMQDGRSRPEVYAQAKKEFEELGNAVVQIGVDTGLISKGEAEKWKEEGWYVPFYRMLDTENARGPANMGALTNQKKYNPLKGGTQQIGDLLTNTLMNWNHIIGAGLRNQAGAKALKSAEKLGIAWKAPKDAHSKDAVYIRENGVEQWYEISETQEGALVLESLLSLNYEGMNTRGMKAMRMFKRALTIGVTASPGFKVRNLLRDTIHAAAVTTASPNMLKNLLVGFKYDTKRMEAGGGAFGESGYIHGSDQEAVHQLVGNEVERSTIIDSKGLLNKAWKWWQDFGARLENVNRVAGFERDSDKTLLERNFNARDQLDFARTGTFPAIRFIAQTVPFFNARLQGLDKMYRSAGATKQWRDKDQQRQFITVTSMYAVASTLLYLAMKDDDDFKEAEDWEKRTYHLFKVPGSDKMYRIPRPFEVGAIAYMSEKMTEQFIDSNSQIKDLKGEVIHTLSDTFSFNPIPQAFKPLVEVYANKNMFTGRGIETMGMQYLTKPERFQPWTSEVAVTASKAMSKVTPESATLSPVQIQHMVRAYTGWAGATILAGADGVIELALRTKNPQKKWFEYEPVKTFAREGDGRHSKSITQFYENLNELSKIWGDIRKYRDSDKGKALMEKHKEKLSFRKQYNRKSRKLSKLRKKNKVIYENQKMDKNTKRTRIDNNNAEMRKIAQEITALSRPFF